MRWITFVLLLLGINLITVLGYVATGVDLGNELDTGNPHSVPVPDVESWDVSTEYNLSTVQKPEQDVLLDNNISRLDAIGATPATADQQPQAYALYRIENTFGPASRIHLYGPSGRVTNDTVDTIVAIMTWRKIANQTFSKDEHQLLSEHGFEFGLGPNHFMLPVSTQEELDEAIDILSYRQAVQHTYQQVYRQDARAVYETTQQIDGHVSPIRNATTTVLALADRMQSSEISANQTVWDQATTVSSSLNLTVSAVKTLDTEVKIWKQASNNLSESSYDVWSLFNDYEEETTLDPSNRPSTTIQAYAKDREIMRNQTAVLNMTLASTADKVKTVATVAGDFEYMGDQAEVAFSTLAQRINTTQGRVNAVHQNLTATQYMIESISAEKEEIATQYGQRAQNNSKLYVDWQTKRLTDEQATSQVHRHLLFIGIIFLSMILFVGKILIAGVGRVKQFGKWYKAQSFTEKTDDQS